MKISAGWLYVFNSSVSRLPLNQFTRSWILANLFETWFFGLKWQDANMMLIAFFHLISAGMEIDLQRQTLLQKFFHFWSIFIHYYTLVELLTFQKMYMYGL